MVRNLAKKTGIIYNPTCGYHDPDMKPTIDKRKLLVVSFLLLHILADFCIHL